MPSCSNYTITKLYGTGDLEFDEAGESRVREYIIQVNAGVADIITPGFAVGCNIGWRIGSTWASNFDVNEGPLQAGSDPAGGDPEIPGGISELFVRHVHAWQLTPRAVRVTVLYSTDPSLWDTKRFIEISTVNEPAHYDFDALDPGPVQFDGPFGCPAYDQNSPNALDALIYGVEGSFETPVPKYNLILSGLYALDSGTIAAISQSVGTLNADDPFGLFPGPQQWLFAGVDGSEMRRIGTAPNYSSTAVWRLEFRFEFDANHHRRIFWQGAGGNIATLPLINPATGMPACRSARLNFVSAWGWASIFS